MEIFGIFILKSFIDVHGPILCLQNGGNSPPKKKFSYIINIYFNVFKTLDKFIIISKIEL